MASKRERIVEAVVTLVQGALPGVKVQRNADKPERIPSSGVVIVRDGEAAARVDQDQFRAPVLHSVLDQAA